MKKDLGAKTILYPMPVLIVGTFDENGIADAMNAAWGCVADVNKVAIYMAKNHKTYENITKTQSFTVSMATSKYVKQADYVGVVSANDELHKFDNTGWHSIKSECINAPIIEELPLTLECKFESFDEESELPEFSLKDAEKGALEQLHDMVVETTVAYIYQHSVGKKDEASIKRHVENSSYVRNISKSTSLDTYWEVRYDKKSGRNSYIYYILYYFNDMEMKKIALEINQANSSTAIDF